MNKKIVFMFSGQGSQFWGMGRELKESVPTFAYWISRLDCMVKDILGESIIEKVFDKTNKKTDTFDNIMYTHPAIFMVEFSLAMTLMERGIRPDFVLGISMGEFASVAISEVMTLNDVLECVVMQAQLLKKYCNRGGMISILDNYKIFYEMPIIKNNCTIAGINSDFNFVISGSNQGLELVSRFLRDNNIAHQVLPVGYGFHSSMIDLAEREFIDFLSKKPIKAPRIRMISSIHGGSLSKISPRYLWDVVRQPMDFPRVLASLEKKEDYVYLDLGQSGTMANFIKLNIRKDVDIKSFQIITPFGGEVKNYSNVCESFGYENRIVCER